MIVRVSTKTRSPAPSDQNFLSQSGSSEPKNPTLASLQNTSRIVASGHASDGYGFGKAACGELVFTTFAQFDYVTTTLTLLPNQWQYVGIVLDASNDANFYVNGSLVETVNGIQQTHPPTLDFNIGSRAPPYPTSSSPAAWRGSRFTTRHSRQLKSRLALLKAY